MNNPSRDQLREFIVSNFMIPPEEAGFGDTDSLLQLGLIDSMGVMEIVAHIQKKYGVTVNPQDVRPENFDSLKAITEFIAKQRGS